MRIATAPPLPKSNEWIRFKDSFLSASQGPPNVKETLRHCWASAFHQDGSAILPHEVIARIQLRGQMQTGVQFDLDQRESQRSRWDSNIGPWFNYTLFPAIVRVPTENIRSHQGPAVEVHYMSCMYSNVEPKSVSVSGANVFNWKQYKTQHGSVINVDMAVLECGRAPAKFVDVHTGLALMNALELMNPKDGSFMWFDDVTVDPQLPLSGIRGPSLGLAVCAAIAGCPPLVYTGYVKRSAYSGLSSVMDGTRTRRMLYDVAKPDDIVESVQDLDLKIGSALASGRIIVIPHVSSLNSTLNTVIAAYINGEGPGDGSGLADRYPPRMFRKQYMSRSVLFRQAVRMYSTSDADAALSLGSSLDVQKTVLLATSMSEVGHLASIAWLALQTGMEVKPANLPTEDIDLILAKSAKFDDGRYKRAQAVEAFKRMTPQEQGDALAQSARNLADRSALMDRKTRATFETKRRTVAARTQTRIARKETRSQAVRERDPNAPKGRPLTAAQKAKMAAARSTKGLTGRVKERMQKLTRGVVRASADSAQRLPPVSVPRAQAREDLPLPPVDQDALDQLFAATPPSIPVHRARAEPASRTVRAQDQLGAQSPQERSDALLARQQAAVEARRRRDVQERRQPDADLFAELGRPGVGAAFSQPAGENVVREFRDPNTGEDIMDV